jgi:large subunit ribosomal protein L24
MAVRIKTGDTVQVIAGREKGATGEVFRVDRKNDRVFVRDLNMVKRHKRPSPTDPDGGIIEKEAPLHLSNVMLYSEQLERGVRVGYRFKGDNGKYFSTQAAAVESYAVAPDRIEKVRVCVKTGEEF